MQQIKNSHWTTTESLEFVFYTGNSMYGTFFHGDSIGYCKTEPETLKEGDVVLFYQPGTRKLIVHRIRKISAAGIWTVGDNNSQDDPWLLHFSDITGLAVCRKNAKGIFAVQNGKAGQYHFYGCQIRRKIINGCKKGIRPLLSEKWNRFRIRKFTVWQHGDRTQYLWHGLRIAWKFNNQIRYCKSWYRLFFFIQP